MDRKEVKKEYERNRENRMAVVEETTFSDVFQVCKGVVTTVAIEMVGYRTLFRS